jgi:hypothetical protein
MSVNVFLILFYLQWFNHYTGRVLLNLVAKCYKPTRSTAAEVVDATDSFFSGSFQWIIAVYPHAAGQDCVIPG